MGLVVSAVVGAILDSSKLPRTPPLALLHDLFGLVGLTLGHDLFTSAKLAVPADRVSRRAPRPIAVFPDRICCGDKPRANRENHAKYSPQAPGKPSAPSRIRLVSNPFGDRSMLNAGI